MRGSRGSFTLIQTSHVTEHVLTHEHVWTHKLCGQMEVRKARGRGVPGGPRQ